MFFGEGGAFPSGRFLPCPCPRSSAALAVPPRAAEAAALPAPECPALCLNDTALLLGSSSSWCSYCFFDNNTDFRLTSHGGIFLPLFLVQHKLLWHPRDGLRHSSAEGLVPQRWTCDPQRCCGHASECRGTRGNSGLCILCSSALLQHHSYTLCLQA